MANICTHTTNRLNPENRQKIKFMQDLLMCRHLLTAPLNKCVVFKAFCLSHDLRLIGV